MGQSRMFKFQIRLPKINYQISFDTMNTKKIEKFSKFTKPFPVQIQQKQNTHTQIYIRIKWELVQSKHDKHKNDINLVLLLLALNVYLSAWNTFSLISCFHTIVANSVVSGNV